MRPTITPKDILIFFFLIFFLFSFQTAWSWVTPGERERETRPDGNLDNLFLRQKVEWTDLNRYDIRPSTIVAFNIFFPLFSNSLLWTSLFVLCKCLFFNPHASFSFFLNPRTKAAPCWSNRSSLVVRFNLIKLHKINMKEAWNMSFFPRQISPTPPPPKK